MGPEGIVTAEPITEEEVRSLFNLWNDALATKDPHEVAARYSKKGVLLPTVSDEARTAYPRIVDYFTNFLKLEPQGEILDGNIIVGTPSPTGVRWTVEVAVEVVVASIKSPAENSSSQEPGTNTKNPAINQLVACADKPGVCRGILAIRAAGAAGTGAIAARVAT